MTEEDLGAKFRRLRRAHDLSQEKVAQTLGVSTSTVCEWERGSMPRVDDAFRLAQLLGTTLDELMQEDTACV